MVADYMCRSQKKQYTIGQLLTDIIKAYEIQGVIALENSFNRVGLDHVLLVKVATTAVVTQMLGGSKDDILNAPWQRDAKLAHIPLQFVHEIQREMKV